MVRSCVQCFHYCERRRSTAECISSNLIAQHLSTAERSIDLALFVFSAQALTDVLARRVQSGVAIRLLADPGFASRSFSEVLDLLGVALPDRFCKLEQGNRPLAKALKGAGTPRLARGDKLHHKFAVIDRKTVITGSFNWSPSAAWRCSRTPHRPRWRLVSRWQATRLHHEKVQSQSDAIGAVRPCAGHPATAGLDRCGHPRMVDPHA